MQYSEQINELAGALAKAQGAIQNAHRDKANPYFNSSYADLASCWDACREALSSNGLSVLQTPSTDENGNVAVTTMLVHQSGQWVRDTMACKPGKNDAQAMGSVTTYLRRYGLMAIVGIAPADDDGNAAVKGGDTGADKMTPAAKWVGPLKKTALKNKMRDFAAALRECKTQIEVTGLVDEYADVLEQCSHDMPTWYAGDKDQPGAEQNIQIALSELPPGNEDASEWTVPVPAMTNGKGANWQAWREKVESLIDDAKSLEAVNEIAEANKAAFGNYTKAQPRNAAGLKKIIDNKRGFLSSAPSEAA